MPDAYLFDIGNVIITFDFSKAARKLAPYSTVPADEALPLVAPLTVELELGHLTPEEFIAAASQQIGFTGDSAFFRSAFEDIFELNHLMVAFINEVKSKGAALYLLSNTNSIHVPFFEAAYPVFDLFDGRVYSHEVGLMKPDPAIYEVAKDSLSLVPERTLYIDDLPANCVAGRAAGFPTVPYSAAHHDEFLEAVAQLAEN